MIELDLVWRLSSSMALLGLSAWASNIWPGDGSWTKAALGRALWWGLPFAAIALFNGLRADHAAYLGLAAWCGAWVPHVAMPNVVRSTGAMLADIVIVLFRIAAVLVAPTAILWLCDVWWFAMVFAIGASIPCILIGNLHTWPVTGLATPRHVTGVLFGASLGFWLAVAITAPPPLRSIFL